MRTWNSQTHPAVVRPGRGVVYGVRVTWLRWKHLRGDASSRPRPANSCVKGLSLFAPRTLISYTWYYDVAYKLTVKIFKIEKISIKNPHPAPYNIIILYDAARARRVCKTLWNLSPFSTAVYIHVYRRAISLYVYVCDDILYTIYIYTYYYTAPRGGNLNIMWERPACAVQTTSLYNDNIVWPFGPCTIIQLFSLLERESRRRAPSAR